ncbi:8-oxo-dGTP diphosphatase [Candidatus Haliotispira prima]|uniref:Oxidized purine nucleoside triphosphate hydrolase n=1 Tax=Candidatus Haliotispira prima TaxID=3034016 RepID=A0ABY8MEP1_9SPIO|nr:8-oxo-dGTP diphosphatase [Candidatus Haliotispira prima]
MIGNPESCKESKKSYQELGPARSSSEFGVDGLCESGQNPGSGGNVGREVDIMKETAAQQRIRQCAEYARSLACLPSVGDIDWQHWQPTVHAVLCYISNRQTDEVLLIKRLSAYAHGLISGPGGKLENGESLEQCVVRECCEEIAVEPHNFCLRADLFFHFTNGVRMRGYAYFTDEWSGEPQSSEEAIPFWCKRDRLPLHQMWDDDALWLPYVLQGGRVRGYFIFDDDNRMLSHDIVWLPAETREF